MLTNNKIIYLISGPLGVGKSSLSKTISQKLGYSLISGDDFFVPLENDKGLSWKDRLKTSWTSIVDATRKSILKNKSVVIDFVVEDELSWFLEQISDLNVRVKYVVLIADKEEIIRRLKKRDGGVQFLKRATVLLNQLQSKSSNRPYIFDTTGKKTEEVFNEVVGNEAFVLK